MTAKYNFDERVVISQPGKYYGLFGTIENRRATGVELGFGSVEWMYYVRLDTGKSHWFTERYVVRVEG